MSAISCYVHNECFKPWFWGYNDARKIRIIDYSGNISYLSLEYLFIKLI